MTLEEKVGRLVQVAGEVSLGSNSEDTMEERFEYTE